MGTESGYRVLASGGMTSSFLLVRAWIPDAFVVVRMMQKCVYGQKSRG